MPELILRSTGERKFVPPELYENAVASGLYETPSDAAGQSVSVELRPGLVGETTLGTQQALQATPEGEGSFRERERETALERRHGGALGAVKTGAESFGNTLLLDAPAVIGEAIGGQAYTENRLERQEAHPYVDTGATIGAIAAPTLLSGGTSGAARLIGESPLGRITNFATRFAEGGTTKLGKFGRYLGGAAIEGGGLGIQSGVEKAVASDKPLSIELVASELPSEIVYGAATNTAFAGGGKVLAEGLGKARTALGKISAAAEKRAGVVADLAGMDSKALTAVEDTERARLATEQVAKRSDAATDIANYQKATQEANPYLVIDEGKDAALIVKSKNSIVSALDDPKALEHAPQTVLKPLRKQEGALARALDNEAELSAKFAKTNETIASDLELEIATLPDNVETVTLNGKAARRYASYADVKVPGRGASATVTVAREDAGEFLGALQRGEVQGAREQAVGKLKQLLDDNRALQAKIEAAAVPKSQFASPRLDEIKAAREALASGGNPGFVQKALTGAAYGAAAGAVGGLDIPGAQYLAPMAGAFAGGMVGKNIFGRMARTVATATERSSKAIDAFLNVTSKAARPVPMIATKLLSQVRYAPEVKQRAAEVTPLPNASKLGQVFTARANEIRSQVVQQPDGSMKMRPVARRQMAKLLQPIAVQDALLADKLETVSARKIEFLASKLPRRPGNPGIPTGPDHFLPSDMEMRTFARYAAAVEDPGGIEERLASGDVTPEDAEVMRSVYPERLAAITAEIIGRLPELQKSLPYKRRLALAIMTGVAVDPSMEPATIAALQEQFVSEPGSAGGTEAPKPMPAFGSVKKSAPEPTPAQQRAG